MLMVGCPVKNDLESLKEMVKSLYASTEAVYSLVFVIGKGCNQETIDYLQNIPTKKDITVAILNDPKNGTPSPLEAYNMLFDFAKENNTDLLLTQTDVTFPKLYQRDWLKHMEEIAKVDHIGAIIPINGGGISGKDYVKGLYWVGGWCTYIPHKTLNQGIRFDDTFPNGYGVDIDFTYQFMQKGLRVAKFNYWVDHHKQNEREHDNDPDAEINKRESSIYFKRKWKN